jgi:hypothetical protein
MRTPLLAAALLLAATSAFADREVEHKFASAAPAGGVHRVVVDIPAGEVTVRNGPANEVRVHGRVTREYDGWQRQAKNQRMVDDISAEVIVNREEAVVRRRYGANARGFRAEHFTEFDIVVEVPIGVTIELQTHYGEVKIDGSFGDILVDMRAGDLDVRTPRANVRELSASCRVGEVTTNLGHEIIESAGLFPRSTRWSKETGSSRLNLHVTAGDIDVKLTE